MGAVAVGSLAPWWVSAAGAQTRVDLRSQSRNVDFSSAGMTRVFKTGSDAPPTNCSTGSAYLRSDAERGIYQLYACTAMNSWTPSSVQTGGLQNRPVECGAGQLFLATDTGTLWVCSTPGNPGTWRSIGGGTGGGGSWDTLGDAQGNVAVNIGNHSMTVALGTATGTSDGFKVTDSAGNSGSGVLGHFQSQSGSGATPWQADASGVGWKVDSTGQLKSVGSAEPGSITLNGSESGSCRLTVPAAGGALLPGAPAECHLGSRTAPFGKMYVSGASAAPGANNFELTGSATAPRTWTLQDASDTLVGRSTADTLANKTLDTAAGNVLRINGAPISSVQGNSGKALFAGAVSGTGSPLCTDANGNASTSGCPGAGVGGPGSSTPGNIPTWNGASGNSLSAGLQRVTTVGNPGSDTAIPTEAAVRAAINNGGGGTVSSVATGCGLAGGPISTSGTISASIAVAAKSANYTVAAGDCGVLLSMTGSNAFTLPQAGSAGFGSNWHVRLQNGGSGTVTVATAGSSFYGGGYSGSSLNLAAGEIALLVSDGANWNVANNAPSAGGASYTAGNGVRITGSVISAAGLCAVTPTSDTVTASGSTFATTCTIPANTLTVGSVIEFSAAGQLTGSTGSYASWGLKIGSATVVPAPTGAWITGGPINWSIVGSIVVSAIGPSGKVFGVAHMDAGSSTSNTAGPFFSTQSASAVTINTTVDQNLAITYNGSSGSNTESLKMLWVRVRN